MNLKSIICLLIMGTWAHASYHIPGSTPDENSLNSLMHSYLEQKFYRHLMQLHPDNNNHVKAAYVQNLKREFETNITNGQLPIFKATCEIEARATENSPVLHRGAGVLIQHTDPHKPLIPVILTTWPLVQEELLYTVSFSGMPTPENKNKPPAQSFSILKKVRVLHETKWLDLCVCLLSGSPVAINPAPRLEEVTQQTVRRALVPGYGDFAEETSPAGNIIKIQENPGMRHAILAYFSLQPQDPNFLNTKLPFEKVGTQYLQQVSNEAGGIMYKQNAFLRKLITFGHKGSPVYIESKDNNPEKIAAIVSSVSIDVIREPNPSWFEQYYPFLHSALFTYQKIASWTKGYLVGEHMDPLWYAAILGHVGHQFLQNGFGLSGYANASNALGATLLTGWAAYDSLGKALLRFQKRVPSYTVNANKCTSYAISLAPVNSDIDKAIEYCQ